MYLADYHTHSRISPDANVTMGNMAKSALYAGMQELCFTDHVEPIYPDGTPRYTFPWPDMVTEFNDAKATWGQDINLRLGMELGEAHLDFSRTEAMLQDMPELDFVIGSVHCLGATYNHVDLCFYTPQNAQDAGKAIENYLQQVESLVDWGHFSVLGHLTLPLRYFNGRHGYNLSFAPHRDQVASIFKTLIDKGLGIELNVNRGGMPLPDGTWLSLYHDLGGKRITIGTDAHSQDRVGQGIAQGQGLLQSCGFTHFCTFDQKSEIWHKLS